MPATKPKKEAAPSDEVVGIELVKLALLDPTVKLSVVEEDPDEAQRRIVQRTLNAKSVDEIWGSGVVHAADCIDRAFKIATRDDVEFRNSEVEDREGGLPIFAVMHVAFCDTGELAIVTCGAAGVVTRLVKLIEFDAFPIELAIRASKTKSGFKVYDLSPVTDGF